MMPMLVAVTTVYLPRRKGVSSAWRIRSAVRPAWLAPTKSLIRIAGCADVDTDRPLHCCAVRSSAWHHARLLYAT
jgi:hypothetical protein